MTDDLISWEPPEVAVGYAADVTGGGTLGNKISRLVSRALSELADAGRSRKSVAEDLSETLGRSVSPTMLDKYASEASVEHRIPLDVFVALIEVSENTRLLGFVPGLFQHAVVPERYTDIVELHLLEEHEAKVRLQKSAIEARMRRRQ